ncbi:hypothetical protein [Nostoc sp. JL23]|uniref:hypothetical protein n=1 Tax=Nostoc sp. JL23 TaxID=2815394 RepID=UPI001D9C38FF|nr:hypothetical protein [Nostoc sp. JL23]MBN3878466.1 hypothetical protein [Nostoc sp. JL23]
MTQTLTWLHLSDIHACKPRTGWDAKRVTDTLCKDLKKTQERYGLRPDLIFLRVMPHLVTLDSSLI